MQPSLPKVLRQLRQAGDGATDAELLARFVADRDEGAFAALVRRYGPMVLGVCRRTLRHAHDAEDAFQATFLVLARRAAAVAKRESVGGYLHAVARHAALAAARANARRWAKERQVTVMPHPQVEPAEAPDWREALDRELGRLMEKHRAALALCDLAGVPQRQAARLLGVSPGTLSGRLSRARALLARRLRGRGVELSGAALAGALASEAVAARVPVALVGTTARVAALVAAGELAGAGAAPAVLMKGVMRVMLMCKLKAVAVALVATAAFGVVGLASRTGEEVRAQEGGNTPARTAGKPADELEVLRQENADLRTTLRVLLKEIQAMKQARDVGARLGNRIQTGSEYSGLFKTAPADTGARDRDRGLPKGATGTSAQPGATKKGLFDGEAKRFGNEHLQGAKPKSPFTSWVGGLDPNLAGADHAIEEALRVLRKAESPEARRRAAEALERATQRLRQQVDPGTSPTKKGE
jgi:RNA polymerase sigma factor (sigma-70 family)